MKTLFLILILSFCAFGQSVLPSNYTYKLETDPQSESRSFILSLNESSIANDALKGKTFQRLGAVTIPDRDAFVLMFFNATREYQLHLQQTKGVTMTIDNEKFDIEDYTLPKKTVIGEVKLEGAVFAINKEIFWKLVEAENVTVRVGIVVYKLDQENLNAFRYFGAEIEKNNKMRNKTKPEVSHKERK